VFCGSKSILEINRSLVGDRARRACAILIEGVAGLIALAIDDGRHGPVMELALVIILVPGLIVSGAGSGWIYRRYEVELVARRQGT
jgi:hypothetical protein